MRKTIGMQLQDIVHEYMIEHGLEEVDLDAAARWAVETGKYQRKTISLEQQCRREMARALRSERHIDPQGREVRTMHPVRVPEIKGVKGEQFVLWADIRNATPKHMRLSFSQNRRRILADVKRHKNDVDSYNDNNKHNAVLPLFDYNFNLDLEEGDLPTEYNEDGE